MSDTAESLIAYCQENNRVCPEPGLWHKLWELLPKLRQISAGWKPPLPLILGAWYYASNLEKMLRLAEHIEWAEKNGSLPEVAAFLRNIAENEWHHLRG